MSWVNNMDQRVGYLTFVYCGFYCNIYLSGGYWEFEVYSGEDDVILWGNSTPITEIGVGGLIEAIIVKLDELNSLNYA
jgi:hypothetical protein